MEKWEPLVMLRRDSEFSALFEASPVRCRNRGLVESEGPLVGSSHIVIGDEFCIIVIWQRQP